MRINTLSVIFCHLAAFGAHGALAVFPAQPITHQVTVNPIVVTDGAMGPAATFFGTPAQQAEIEAHVDTIMAQAGIDVEWLVAKTFSSTFLYDSATNMSHYAAITPETIESTVPEVVNMWFVQKVAENTVPPSNGINGRAFIDGEGVALSIGSDLLTPIFDPVGLEVIAAVTAHELAHNLGLVHVLDEDNLLLAPLTTSPVSAEINAGQVATIFTDDPGFDGYELLTPLAVPEPSSGFLAFAALALIGCRRRRS